MKLIKLSAVSAAVLASTAALAAEPIVVVDDADAVAYEAQPVAYEAEPVAYNNPTSSVFDGTKSFFNTVTHPAAVSAEIGSLGYGANIAWGLNENTELQAGWAGGDVADLFGGDIDVDDVNYDVDSDFSNPYLGVQMRPASNWFTVGGGIIVPDNDLDVTSNPDGNGIYEIDNVKYVGKDVGQLNGSIEHRNTLAPYATIGFRPNISDKWGVFGELGAAYLGKTDATVNAANPDNSVGIVGSDVGTTAGQVAAEAQKELEDKNYLEWLPIVKLGATYRF